MIARFEIYAADVPAAKTFYTTVLGWEFEPMPGAEAVEYHLIKAPGIRTDIGTGIGTDEPLSGGLMKRPDATPTSGGPIRGCTITFTVEDCDATYAKALANGGAEALPPMDFPGLGRCAYMEDGFGNVFGIITPLNGSQT